MSLQDYLVKYFPTGAAAGEFEGQVVDLKSHFFDKFGVHVKTENNLFQFKYDMLAAKFSFPLVKECRGHIWRFDGTWNRVANVFDKFFNQGEGYCPIFNNVDFEQKLPALSAVRKEDGTCIPVWNDAGIWRASTLGTITPFKVGDYEITFDTLFWNTVGAERRAKFEAGADKEYTYTFELCAVQNRIVTKYPTDTVFMLSKRHTQYGTYDWVGTDAEAFGFDVPERFYLNSIGIKSIEQLQKWVEMSCQDVDQGVQYREGFVIYDGMTPIAKMKTARYLNLHHVGGGDIGCTRNAVIDSYFAGSLDDIWGVLHESMQTFANKLRDRVVASCEQVVKKAASIDSTTIVTQKDYALWVKANIEPQYHPFFFQNKEMVLNKEEIREAFMWWMKSAYVRFDWKSEQ